MTQTIITHATQIERQSQLSLLLENYGVTYQSCIGIESENTYAKENSSFGIATVLAYDVDLAGVFEATEKIEGMSVVESTRDNGFKTASYPVLVVTFNN